MTGQQLNDMDNQYEYELIEIAFEPDESSYSQVVCDDSEVQYGPIEYDEDGIPKGKTPEETEIRRKIIHEHIQRWRAEHADNPSVYNVELGENIKISQVFLLESVAHSAVRYLSTKAILQMETIMAQAKEVGLSKVKQTTENQKPFVRMLVMIYKSKELGSVKMTVGIRKKSEEKVEYSITVPTPGTPFIEKGMRVDTVNKKKKAPHKK